VIKVQLKECVTIRVGKNGVTKTLLEEIRKNIESKNNVKVKLLKNFVEVNDKKKAVEEIKQYVASDRVNVKAIGNSVLVEHKKQRKNI